MRIMGGIVYLGSVVRLYQTSVMVILDSYCGREVTYLG